MDEKLLLKIEAYLSNSMTNEESLIFEQELKQNESLQKEVDLAKELNHFLSDGVINTKPSDKKYEKELTNYFDSEEAKNIEKLLRDAQQEYRTSNETPVRKISQKKIFYAAASITIFMICVFSYNLLNKQSTEKLFVEYYQASDLPSVTKRADEQNDLINGVKRFNDSKYKESLELLKVYESTENLNPSVYIYAGMANLKLIKYQKAIIEFDKLINSNSIDKSKGLWFKALTYLKMKDKRNARMILEIIIQNENNFKFKEAKELLEKLN